MAFWRSMLAVDLPAVETLADEAHPELPESVAVFAERLRLFPAGCFVLEVKGAVYGYIISHPILRDDPPYLDTMLGHISEEADMYYIHDIVVANQLRGRGLASTGVKQALLTAAREDCSRACIFSVYGTSTFWGRHGFKRQEVAGPMADKLSGYGPDAVYMVREISPQGPPDAMNSMALQDQ